MPSLRSAILGTEKDSTPTHAGTIQHALAKTTSTEGPVSSEASTVLMSTTKVLNLSDLPAALVDGDPVALATLQGLLIVNTSETAILEIGPTAAAPLAGIWKTATERTIVGPGGQFSWGGSVAVVATTGDQIDITEVGGVEDASYSVGAIGLAV